MKNKLTFFKIIKRKISKLFYIIFGWLIIVPIATIIPKKKNLFSFIGRDKGKLLDNVKYLYLYFNKIRDSHNKKFLFFFITEDNIIFDILKKHNLNVYLYPSFKSIWVCLRSEYLIIDNMMWISNFKYFLFFRAKRVQLWHGVAFKRIYLDEPKYLILSKKIKFILKLLGYNQKFHYLISTSPFYTKTLFQKAFKSNNILETGYPRNDILKNQKKYGDYQFLNTDKKIIEYVKRYKMKMFRIIIYMPTFRDSRRDFLNLINLETLNDFAVINKFLFIFKLHPDTIIKKDIVFNNIIFYENSKDIYPLLPLSDLLITDYSSIYMDYLLLNKPIVFFPFDKDEYLKKDRDFQFDYDNITPGPKAYTQKELEKIIINTFKKDDYIEQREQVKKMGFKYDDENASERIFNYLIQS